MGTPGAWYIVRNGFEAVARGGPSASATEALARLADGAEELLGMNYPGRTIRRTGNRFSAYVDVMGSDGKSILQREFFIVEEV